MLCSPSGSKSRRVLPQQVDEGPQLKPWDVGPTAAFFHGLQQRKQLLAIFWKALAERTLLHIAMDSLQFPQQQQQVVGIVLFLIRQRTQFLKQWCQPLVQWLVLLAVQRTPERC